LAESAKTVKEAKEQRNVLGRGRDRLDVPDSPFGERAQEWILEHNVEHLHGPEEVGYEMDELVVLVQVRNGRPYVRSFVEHYFSLGAKHIVFLDNGSTDGTVETLKNYENVTVLRSGLPNKRYHIAMKRYLIERFGRGRWTLSVDIDELFEYPYSDVVSLKALLGYLKENSYTAVVSYMLDMFPEEPLSEEDSPAEDLPLKERHRFYDISDIRTRSYHDVGEIGNVLPDEKIKVLKGGVRWRLFGIHPLLTKHPLVFLDDKLRPMDLSDHWAGNARVADFTGILLHYKLSDNLYRQVRREIRERRDISVYSGRYDKYLKVLEEAPSLLLKNDTSRELKSVNELVGTRFVSVSKRYMRFVEDEEQRGGRDSEASRSERLNEAFFNARAEVAAQSEKVRDLERKLANLERQLATKNERLAKTNERLVKKRAEAHRARKQVQAIESSRGWRILTTLSRVKTRARSVLGRSRNGV
jgi:glycosyltransferase involved in cell wall biosynthesis